MIENRGTQLVKEYSVRTAQLSKKKVFGESSEKIAEEYGQLNLFNEAKA